MYIWYVNVDLSRHDQMVHPLSYNPEESEKRPNTMRHDTSAYIDARIRMVSALVAMTC